MPRRSGRNSTPLGGPGPRDWSPPGWDLPYPPAQQARRRRLVAVLGAAIGVSVIITLLVNGSDNGSAHAPIADVPSSGSTDTKPPVLGLTQLTDPGTCFDAPSGARVITVTVVACHTAHDFELVAHESASGSDNHYPGDSYWDGPVAAQCYRDLRSYTGQPRDRWPTTLRNYEFIPRADGWASGDRYVYCVAQDLPRQTGTVRHLRPSRHRAIAPVAPRTSATSRPAPTAAVPAPVTAPARQEISGVLSVVSDVGDVCLSVRLAGGAQVVLESGTSGLSWLARTTSGGSADDARSGIASGRTPAVNRIVVHTGSSATLTGTYETSPTYVCGTTQVFAFTSVHT